MDELLLKGPRGEETVEVGSEEFGDKVDVLQGGDEDVGERDDVFVPDVLEQLELAVRSLGEDRGAEGLHDLLDGHARVCQLVLG